MPFNGEPLIRFAGGYENDVYRSADRRFVVKIRRGRGRRRAVRRALAMRAIAECFTAFLGARHTVRSDYVVAHSDGVAHALVLQPFLEHATPLDALHDGELSAVETDALDAELREIMRRAWSCYRSTGRLPDLYGLGGASADERLRHRAWCVAPLYLWTFLVTHTLLRSHNLLLTQPPRRRVVLVDYDIALGDRHHIVRRLYSAVRVLLFVRDLLLLRQKRHA